MNSFVTHFGRIGALMLVPLVIYHIATGGRELPSRDIMQVFIVSVVGILFVNAKLDAILDELRRK